MTGTRIPRIGLGGIIHETHSFAATPTGLQQFREQSFHRGTEILEAMHGTRSGIGGMIQGALERGWQLFPTLYAAAMPGGIVDQDAFAGMLDEMLRMLRSALPLDGVLLALHGAMVAGAQLDAEGYILERVREVVGPETPIVVELDMHGNVSPAMVAHADILVAFDTNPHTDPWVRGIEAVSLLARRLDGTLHPVAALRRLPLLLPPQATGTGDLPLSAVHRRAAEMEQQDGVVCICVMAGFAYADTPYTGASIVVTTDDDTRLAEACAAELDELLLQNRHAGMPEMLQPDAAIARALELPGGPILLVDSADNIGAGTPGDGTEALRAMLAHGVVDGTVVLADPAAVAECWAAGAGNPVTLAVGGKADRMHGAPVPLSGFVVALSDGVFACELPDNHFASFYGDTIRMGRTCLLRAGGVNIILTERKTPPFDLAQLRGVGVIPEAQKMIVVKSAVAYRAAYLPIAAGVIEMDTAGLCTANLARFPYRHVSRPVLPLDELPADLRAEASSAPTS